MNFSAAKCRLYAGVLALLWISTGGAHTRQSEETAATEEKTSVLQAPSAEEQSPSYNQTVYLDQNGQRIAPPPGKTAISGLPRLNRSARGLVQHQSPISGRGVILDLQGRFRSFEIATRGGDGKISITCIQSSHQPHSGPHAECRTDQNPPYTMQQTGK